MRNRLVCLLVLWIVGVTWPVVAADSLPANEPITYTSEGLKITGTLTRPKGDGPFPLVLVNHGGFDPATTMNTFCSGLARLNCVAIASDYRGVGKSEGKRELAKGEVTDVLSAIDYAATLPYVDTQRVAALGFSHGGCISLLAAARDPRIKCVVDYVGPTDMAEVYQYWVRTSDRLPTSKLLAGVSTLVGGTPAEVPDAWHQRSPLMVAAKIRCPVLMVYGAKDELVPLEQGQKMATALKAAGNQQVTFIVEPNSGHAFAKDAWPGILLRTATFLGQHLMKTTPESRGKEGTTDERG
jgi:dipeptidyl aminopeptidase/acylaminoacyl peptidase